MQIFVNRLTRKLQRSVADSREPSSPLQYRRGDVVSVEIIYIEAGAQVQLAASSSVIFALKSDGKYDSTALVYEDGFTLSGSGSTAKYTATPSFNSEELNDEFLIDENPENDVARLTLMGEITWSNGATTDFTSTDTFSVIVNNDVIRDEEVTPTPGAVPIGDTAPVNAVAAVPNFLETSFAGANNDLRFNQVGTGTAPTITLVKFGASISVAVVGTAITITVGGAFGAIYVTAADIKAAMDASSPASALVTTSYKSGNDGSGGVAPGGETIDFGPTSLSGGSAAVTATVAPPYIRTAGGFLYIQEAGVWKKTALSAL